jgi:hypothetical protein
MTSSPANSIKPLIYFIRNQRVMLDRDLAVLYEVETKVLKQAVKRNSDRFPKDFMFQLTEMEELNLRSQFVTSSGGWGGQRYPSLAFTELGIAMLSSVLKSDHAIQTNILIMRTFFELRKLLGKDSEAIERIENLESQSNRLFKIVFHRLDRLESQAPLLPPGRRKIGF